MGVDTPFSGMNGTLTRLILRNRARCVRREIGIQDNELSGAVSIIDAAGEAKPTPRFVNPKVILKGQLDAREETITLFVNRHRETNTGSRSLPIEPFLFCNRTPL